MPQTITDVLDDPGTETARIAAAKKDLSAFDALYRGHVNAVYRYLYSRVGNAKDAEDLTAQTFLAALEAFPRYKHKGQFAAWLFSIARNKTIDHFRVPDRQADLGNAEQLTQGSDLLQQAVKTERIAALKALIQSLPEDERELLRLRFVAELPFGEIGAVLKRKPDTVKKSLYRLLARMQAELEEDHE